MIMELFVRGCLVIFFGLFYYSVVFIIPGYLKDIRGALFCENDDEDECCCCCKNKQENKSEG